jgi:toxin secretion/phage lysis holin
MDYNTKIKSGITGIGAAIGMCLDNIWGYFFFAFLLMIIDYITGLMAGAIKEGLTSRKATKGIFKKVGIITLLVFGFILDAAFHYIAAEGFNFDLPFNMPIGIVVSVWVVITEAISICENLDRVGVPIPKWLVKILARTRDKFEQYNETNDNGGK